MQTKITRQTRKRQSDGDTPAELAARGKRWHRAASRAWVKDHPGHTVADFDHWGSCAATDEQERHWLQWRSTFNAQYWKCVMRRTSAHVIAVAIAALLMPTDATAQSSRTIYGSDGRVQSRTLTDSQGATTIYGADGKVQGRTAVTSEGTVIYDSAGRRVGTITAPTKSK
jgi:hypothetical protein